jgi:enediyne biosynthesis protein E3
MALSWRAARARLMTPSRSSTQLDVRGFHVKSESARQGLEAVGGHFLDGFQTALAAPGVDAAGTRLDAIERRYRGFAYEGAAMAFAILDGLTPGGGTRAVRFIQGPAARHVYMAYVGIGWAYAKLPKLRWSAVSAPDPLLRWLVLDGYGFYHAYFETDRYVRGQALDPRLPAPAAENPGYARRVVDQGIGRAMWFVAGADPALAASMIGEFQVSRRADLWAGTGLAASYAGAADEAELTDLRERAGQYQPDLAQGAAFACGARVLAGLVIPHTELAARVFCGCTAAEASAVNDDARRNLPADGPLPAYEVWRQRIANRFRSTTVHTGGSDGSRSATS